MFVWGPIMRETPTFEKLIYKKIKNIFKMRKDNNLIFEEQSTNATTDYKTEQS